MATEARASGDRFATKLTYEDYRALPDRSERYQIIGGELHVTPAPTLTHQRISRNLEFLLLQHVRGRELGFVYHAPLDLILDDSTVVQPDIVFVRRERREILSERGLEAGPDLAVEILSAASRRIDRVTKAVLYARAGVGEYWIVDPDARTAEVLVLKEGAYVLAAALTDTEVLTSPLLPELRLDLREVFAED